MKEAIFIVLLLIAFGFVAFVVLASYTAWKQDRQ
jgi:hypothetical protein